MKSTGVQICYHRICLDLFEVLKQVVNSLPEKLHRHTQINLWVQFKVACRFHEVYPKILKGLQKPDYKALT